MKKDESEPILRAISELFRGDLAYVNFEMIHPADPFGRVMLENLEVSNSYLNSLLGERMQFAWHS